MYSNYRQEPDYPAALGLLSHLNIEELKELLNDDSKFEEMMKDVKQFKELETEKEMLMASNRSLAEFNLAKEPQLVEGKRHLRELSEKGELLCQSVDSKITQLKQQSGDLSLETTLALLQTAAAESEEESESIAEKFLEGELDLETFLDQFATRRKLMHLRRVKADKMAEILTKQPRQNNTALSAQGYSPLPVPGYYPAPPVATNTPYPIGGVRMPMPGSFGF